MTPLQMARFYALIANGGKLVTPHIVADVEQPGNDGSPPVRCTLPAARRRTPIDVDPAALSVVRDGPLRRRRTRRTARPPASSAASRSRSPARRAPPRRSSTCPAIRSGISRTSRGGAATARPTSPTIVVCAVIENGGHGGTAAAPAALKVFEQYFQERGAASSGGRLATDGRSYAVAPARARVRRASASTSSAFVRAARLGPARRGRGARRLRALGDRRDHAPRLAGNESYYVVRQAIFAGARRRSASSSRSRSTRRLPPRPEARSTAARSLLMLLVFPLARRDARLAALDRPRLLPLPAVRVRQAAVRPRARRLPRRSRAAARRPSGRRCRRSRSRRADRCSSSSSPTSARRSSTPPRSPPCCSSPAIALAAPRGARRGRRARGARACSGCCRRPGSTC